MTRLAVVAALLAFASAPALAAIAGSGHDFSSETWNSSGEICKPCHVPHNPNPGGSTAPLWNHTLTSQTFTMYGTTVAGTTPDATPNAKSKLCLSCHDGVTNLDAFGGAAGSTPISGAANIGITLADDHPVSIAITPGSKGIKGTLGSNVVIYSNKVECASCHDIHNSAGVAKLLRTSNAASALCLECHNK
ncbi:MAG: cytochrome c3 family protein [Planctomycetes bacterium]|nr:cytochrome c3 family protein [Planctomycetota bacterium]